ncbi:SDR family oxidoreductase [Litorilituus sediminis]|uniref:SDR family oxidoreductase n=2 Tax=Litorilituus sediminis TaxID=718192 RepID=A0A4P6P7L0_9GAMM|nr:SDR family oxidoreductase [Litorilituus sediminis]
MRIIVKGWKMTDKVYLITGAGSGIGAAISKRLAAKDTLLILHTKRNDSGLDAVAQQCQAQGAKVICHLGDLAKIETINKLCHAVKANSEHLTGLVSNAGFPDWRNFAEIDSQGINDSLQVIVQASFALIQACTPLLLAKSPSATSAGKVIAVSSFLAHKYKVGTSYVPASSAAKAALEALIKSYAAQYAPKHITANIIVPGYIRKNSPDHKPLAAEAMQRIVDRIPAGRLGQPDEVADLCEFLLSDKANYITGQCLHIDGGLLLG